MSAIRPVGKPLAEWTASNPVLLDRELVIESDTRRMKIGNGISTYNELEYLLQTTLVIGESGTPSATDWKSMTTPGSYEFIDSALSTNRPANFGVPVGEYTYSYKVFVFGTTEPIAYIHIGDEMYWGKAKKIFDRETYPDGSSANAISVITDLNIGETLSGVNYLMVYGVGTPEENAAELLTAYEAAKNMPRYLGNFSDSETITFKAGQTISFGEDNQYIRFIIDGSMKMQETTGEEYIVITEAEAKSTRTTLIVAPGKYTFTLAEYFNINTPYIDVVSLTGNRDVIIDYIFLTSDNVFLKGIYTPNNFNVAADLDNSVIENCYGGTSSFGNSVNMTTTTKDCEGGAYSWGSNSSGVFNALAINCVGGLNSFGTSDGDFGANGRAINCRLTVGEFPTPATGGRIINCLNGDYELINV